MLGAILVGILLFSAFYRVILVLSQLKKTRYIGRVGYTTLATLPRDIQEKISDGLTAVDETGAPLPSLAERWTVEDDGKTYRFVLKKNLRWHDGKEVVPQDISYNFIDTQILTTTNEIIFKLKDSYAPFPVVVSQPLFREQKTRALFFFTQKKIIGTGTHRIIHVTQEGVRMTELELESPDERLVYRFYPTESRAFLAYKRGEVDVLEQMSRTDGLQEWKRTSITPELRKDQYLAIFFNMSDPTFDKNIRQALNYALEKPVGDERAATPLNTRSWAYNRTVKEYARDEDKAVSLLLRSIPKQRFTIEMTTVSNFQQDAERVRDAWESLGEKAVVVCEQSKNVVQKSDCKNLALQVQLHITNAPNLSHFQVLLIAQQVLPDPDQYSIWHSTQQTNFTGYRNPHVDKLLEDGRKTIDKKERKSIYQDFQQYLVEDTPAIFLRRITLYTIERL